MEMKYIMLANHQVHMPVIFPAILVHSEIATALLVKYDRLRHHEFKIVSAGFIDLWNIRCFGESKTLNIKSRPEDSEIIRNYNYQHGLIFNGN